MYGSLHVGRGGNRDGDARINDQPAQSFRQNAAAMSMFSRGFGRHGWHRLCPASIEDERPLRLFDPMIGVWPHDRKRYRSEGSDVGSRGRVACTNAGLG
jgi:hypothetical protein